MFVYGGDCGCVLASEFRVDAAGRVEPPSDGIEGLHPSHDNSRDMQVSWNILVGNSKQKKGVLETKRNPVYLPFQ